MAKLRSQKRGSARRCRCRCRWFGASGLLCVFLLLSGCGGSSTGRGGESSLRGTELDQARRLYAQLKRAESLDQNRNILDLANSLLDYYPAFSRNDEVIAVAIEAAASLADGRRALGLVDELLRRYPKSSLVDRTVGRGVELALGTADTLRAAEYLITAYDRDPLRETRSDGLPRAAKYLDGMSLRQLSGLSERHQDSGLGTYLGFLVVQKRLAAGDFAAAGDMAARLEKRAPDDRWTAEALAAVGGGQRSRPHLLKPMVEVDPHTVGVMVPLTGRYALLGNAFYEAVVLAVAAGNQDYGTSFELKLEDTAADPVTSALVARNLCDNTGSIAVLGGLLSAPTASAAVVCDAYGTPLVSPTATNDNIWKLGPAIFQTNITGLYEVRLLARLATTVLDKKRFAVIHPDNPEGLRHAQVFQAEIESRGGQVVASEAFSPQGTDFKDQILGVRRARPEVIFAPATVDQMVLLGPQLDFYRAGALVMGLSNWNSDKLRNRGETGLQRAIFPDDLVMFPSRWEVEFNRTWDAATYPPEATALALKAYQATRMLLDTLVQTGAVTRGQLSEALRRRLANQDFNLEGPESFGPIMRMFQGKNIVPFPASLFAESWAIAAAADSLPEMPEMREMSEMPEMAAPADSAPADLAPVNGDG